MTITTVPTVTTIAGALMRAEIGEQAGVVASLLSSRRAVDAIAAEVGRKDIRCVLLAARGTSDHAAL